MNLVERSQSHTVTEHPENIEAAVVTVLKTAKGSGWLKAAHPENIEARCRVPFLNSATGK